MGAWPYLRLRFGERLLGRYPLDGVCRPESATPGDGVGGRATGSSSSILMEKVFGPQCTAKSARQRRQRWRRT